MAGWLALFRQLRAQAEAGELTLAQAADVIRDATARSRGSRQESHQPVMERAGASTGTACTDGGAALSVAEAKLAGGDLVGSALGFLSVGYQFYEGGDGEAGESCYRRALALARTIDNQDSELFLAVFRDVIVRLSPSAEAVELAEELTDALTARHNRVHPLAAAEALQVHATALLSMGLTDASYLDLCPPTVRKAIAAADAVCFHSVAQELQLCAAHMFGLAGRTAEAKAWQAEADRHEDWEIAEDQEIPGHVHLWDIRITLPRPPHGAS